MDEWLWLQRTGRPKGRREALLRAAAEVFFEQGYAATSIDAIIERAGGSKRNIYNEFGNKQGLFSAIVKENADKVLSTLVIEEIGRPRLAGDADGVWSASHGRLHVAHLDRHLPNCRHRGQSLS